MTTYADARDAYRHRDLRQALYDEGDALMHGVIVNLHGAEHAARRRLENRLFRRDTFAWFEAEVIPAVIAEMLTPALAAGRVDLLTLSRQTMINLSLRVAGVDRPLGTADELDHLYSLMDRLARASTVASATGDKAAIIDDGNSALDELAEAFYAPSLARRQALLSVGVEADYPADVLMTLVRNQDHLDLPADTLLREIAYYPWVGSHSTSNQFVHAMHHMFRWLDSCPGDRQRLTNDASWRQRFVHESLRLHPASAVSLRRALADITLKSGVEIGQGDTVAISLQDANCDPLVFGPTAADFRSVPHAPRRRRRLGSEFWTRHSRVFGNRVGGRARRRTTGGNHCHGRGRTSRRRPYRPA